MFKNKHFYHEHIRKAIISFGTLFNGIYIRRKNSANEIAQSMLVPLSYAPKQKMIARIQEAANFEEGRAKYEVTVPRMAFEITNFQYDASRKLVPIQKVKAINTSNNSIRYGFVSTPYNMGINLSVFAKNQDDGLQIVEQILPYFNPDFNVTINELPELGVKRDLQFVLDGVSYNEDYMGNFDKRLAVTWDLTFTVKLNFFGYVQDMSVIKKTIANIYSGDTSDYDGVKITTTPDPLTASPTDNYSYIQEFDNLFLGE